MPSILVTGANGQLGKELKQLDNAADLTFHFTDHAALEITDAGAVQKYFKDRDPDFCINGGAYTDVNGAESEKEKAFAVNETGAKILAQACAEHETVLLQPSTDFIFEGTKNTPYKENDPTGNPLNVYGASKLAGEKAALEHNPHTLVIRTSWVYSSYGSNFVKTMLRLGKEKDRLEVVYDQVGTPTYAHDLAKAMVEIIGRLQKRLAKNQAIPENELGIFHYSNEGVLSWYDFAVAIMDIAGLDCRVNPVKTEDFPTPATRPPYSLLDKSKIKRTFNLTIPYWRESLADCLNQIQSK